MRKTYRSVCDKGIQKRTTLDRDGAQMRDRPQRMTSNPKEKMMNLSQLGMPTGQVRSGLCPTRNQPAGIRWEEKAPTADCQSNQVEQFRTSTSGGWVSRIQDGKETVEKTQIWQKSHRI